MLWRIEAERRQLLNERVLILGLCSWIVKRLSAMGITQCRLRTDPEETIVAVAKQVQQNLRAKVILEKTPVASHESIGGVERFHRMSQDQVRTLKIETELA